MVSEQFGDVTGIIWITSFVQLVTRATDHDERIWTHRLPQKLIVTPPETSKASQRPHKIYPPQLVCANGHVRPIFSLIIKDRGQAGTAQWYLVIRNNSINPSFFHSWWYNHRMSCWALMEPLARQQLEEIGLLLSATSSITKLRMQILP